MGWAVRGRSSSVFGPSVWQGPRDRKDVALTFDDGPGAGTAPILEILDHYRVPATFFLCGMHVRRTPSLAAEIVAAGHEPGNHTDTHPRLWMRSPLFIREELRRAQDSIAGATGVVPRLFRPTYGVRWFGLRVAQEELGLLGVMWSTIGRDWALDAPAVSRRLIAGVRNGAIFCLHDGRERNAEADASNTVEAVRLAIPRLLDDGWEFLPVSRLVGYSRP
jgi:peptidoglycan/xylan/chitin deacetylase (PgdA/CDA1 family)